MTPIDQLVLKLRNEHLKNDRNYFNIALPRWRTNLEIVERLKACGLWRDVPLLLESRVKYGHQVEVQTEDLPALRRVFDQVRDTGAYTLHDVETNTVRVWLDVGLGDFSDSWSIRIYYVKQLPPDSRCKIVTEVETKARVECGMGAA